MGTVYFLGALITILPLTVISDFYGRYWISFISNIVFVTSVFIIENNQDFDFIYFLLFFAGTTLGGRMVVGQTQLNEYTTSGEKPRVIEFKLWSLYI